MGSALAKGFEERKVRLGNEEKGVPSSRLFNQGSAEILETVRKKKRGGVGFVEIEMRLCSKFAGAVLGDCPQFSLKTLEIVHKGFNKIVRN